MPRFGFFAALSILIVAPLAPVAAQNLLWTRQIGTPAVDFGYGMAVDGGNNAYITGFTSGSLAGPIAGDADAFLAKYDASGTLLWTRQIGTPASDVGYSVAVDGAGNAYITGGTRGSLGGPNAGDYDAFLAKYDASGTLLWTRQIGTPASDVGYSVAVDGAGNAYITGGTRGSLGGPNAGDYDAFLAKYDASGTLLWTRQIGTPASDVGYSVAVDGAGNAYIGGTTQGGLGGPNAGELDAFLAKYDGSSGTLLWTRQIGTPASDEGYSVAVDGAGNAYITGGTRGSLGGPNAGDYDTFLAKYDASGALLWTRQIGTPASEFPNGVAVDGAGNEYIGGTTQGGLGGPNAGELDAFLAKYDGSGAQLWTRQIGTSASDFGFGVAVDGAGNAYISGTTQGGLGGPNAGTYDAFLAKYGPHFCYANCDGSTMAPILNVNDFICFNNRFAANDPYANCDGSPAPPTLTVNDFICFLNKYAAGCP